MAETKPQETHDTCETRETSEDKLHETCDTEVAPVAPLASPVAPVDVPVDVPVMPVMPVMPKLTSRKIGGLVTWVVDRHALAKASKISTEDPSPISPQRPRDREDRDGSPKTPSFKPSLPRRAFKEANRSNRSNGPECDAKCDEVPEKVAVAHTGEKIEKESERDETENEDSDSDACCSETETPSASNSPCSASEDPSEGQAFQGHGYPYGIPFWPVYFPVAGCQPNWWNMNEIAAQHLDACHKIALQRAERRGAPTETCCVGCCCSRCIGIPAAYQPKKSEERLLKEKDEKDEKAKPKTLEDENQGKDCDTISVQESLQETASSTSVSSGSSDSDMDVDEILNQLPPTRTLTWTTPDPRLQQHLRRPKLLRTVVCTNLHTDAIATDVHQAFQQRFIALPDYVDGYWKEGRAAGQPGSGWSCCGFDGQTDHT